MWTNGVEQRLLVLPAVYADELLIERDGQGRGGTEARHLLPLSLADGLFDAVNVVAGQTVEHARCLGRRETAVGVDPQLHRLRIVTAAQTADECQFTVEIDGPDLQFHAGKAFGQLLLHAAAHLLIVSHPHEAVDAQAAPPFRERRGKKQTIIAAQRTLSRTERRFQSEEHGGKGTQRFRVEPLRAFHLAAHCPEPFLIVGREVAAEVGQRRTLAQPRETEAGLGGREQDVPHAAFGVDTARGAGGLLETERARQYTQTEGRKWHRADNIKYRVHRKIGPQNRESA